ncbi:hypothetical protein KCP77_13075 [Salmonella enterica subsp. enterica]|nr:hypothetical protein KCP77_13075 [Salmonella enterica subsp. enterica]
MEMSAHQSAYCPLPAKNSRWARLVADAADRDGSNHAAIDAVCWGEPLPLHNISTCWAYALMPM